MNTRSLLSWLLAGVLSTMTMDLGSTLVRMTGFTAGLTPPLIGRWFASLARGELTHHDIATHPAVAGEVPIALVAHYIVGTSLTLLFGITLFLLRVNPATTTAFLVALGFGIATNLFPWLWMFPSMGYGLFGVSAPAELMLLRSSFVNHLFFAVGLAVTSRWVAVSPLIPSPAG